VPEKPSLFSDVHLDNAQRPCTHESCGEAPTVAVKPGSRRSWLNFSFISPCVGDRPSVCMPFLDTRG